MSPGRPFIVGSSRAADLILHDSLVSRRHLVVEVAGDQWIIRDISLNGTWLDNRKVRRIEVRENLTLRLGRRDGTEISVALEGAPRDPHHELTTIVPPVYVMPPVPPLPIPGETGPQAAGGGDARRRIHPLRFGRISLGRSQDNDLVIGDLLASRSHAEILVGAGGVEIVDLSSANGTFLNGTRITRAVVAQRDVIAIGHHLFQLSDESLIEYVDTGDVSFEATGLSVSVDDGRKVLDDVSFRLRGGALLAVIGPSGAGKSTLLNALTGFRPADQGTVRYAGRDMYANYDELRRRIGYVPQDDILHPVLTVRQAMNYGARLRFPADTTQAERMRRIDDVLLELGLTTDGQRADDPAGAPRVAGHDLAHQRISHLSGGQRKRTSVALELLTRPTLLYLDEPTSGLDPGLDMEVMESLRRLADGGRTVIVVTHSIAQLHLCDSVLVLAAGGRTAYFGPPENAMRYFEESNWASVFRRLADAAGSEEAAERFRRSPYFVPASVTAPTARPSPAALPSIRQQSVLSQFVTLSRRYLRVIASDVAYLRLICAFPFILGLVPRIISATNGMNDGQFPNLAVQQILLLIVVSISFMGMSNAIQEIVKERAVYRRERTIGLSIAAYLGSKICVVTLITVAQSAILTSIAISGRAPRSAVTWGSPTMEILFSAVLLAWASAMLGLLFSTIVDTADKTMPLLVVGTIGQLVFSGGFVILVNKPILNQLSYAFPSRWGFAAMASVADYNHVMKLGTILYAGSARDPLWNHSARAYLFDTLLGLAVGLTTISATFLSLRRGDVSPARGRGSGGERPASRGSPSGAAARAVRRLRVASPARRPALVLVLVGGLLVASVAVIGAVRGGADRPVPPSRGRNAPVPLATRALSLDTFVFSSTHGGNTDIYSAALTPTHATKVLRLTSGPDQDLHPVIVPGRRTIVYFDGSHNVLRVMGADGTGNRPLFTRGPAAALAIAPDSRPAIAPDGQRLAVSVSAGSAGPGLYVAGLDGTTATRLAAPADATDPAWSPDGRRIAYASGARGIWALPTAGGPARQLTSGPFDADPTWSPNSDLIAYTHGVAVRHPVGGRGSVISTVTSDGKHQRDLTRPPGRDTDAAYEPNADRIAFASARTGDREIYIMNADGNNVHRITFNTGFDGVPRWSAG